MTQRTVTLTRSNTIYSSNASYGINFVKLLPCRLFRDDLKEATEDILYENYRTEQLQNKPSVA